MKKLRLLLLSRDTDIHVDLTEYFPFEFHICENVRKIYDFDESIFKTNGNVVLADFKAARLFAQKMNSKRDLIRSPEQAIRAGEVNAMGLIDEILHYLLWSYRQEINENLFKDAQEWLTKRVGSAQFETALIKFVEVFPPVAVHKKEISVKDYLAGQTDGVLHKDVTLEEMLMLWLANLNPAFSKFKELFDDRALRDNTAYESMMDSLATFFETQPKFGPGNYNLYRLLRLPALERPHSLEDQLRFLTSAFGVLLTKFDLRLLSSMDLIREEIKTMFSGQPPTEVVKFDYTEYEAERFSHDLHWMPELVLIAKSTLVWLDQLSKKYQQPITRLDQIPDEEIETLARWGFTGLWLIGIWQRSDASKRVKQACGNPEAESSAYSLFDYEIAHELGGYDALQNLKSRCWKYGLRLACDMVPNHTGIDSRWMRDHPDWFVSLPYSPFPSYTFNSMNLSQDERYGVFIEDKYYNQSDAAVVFKREDYWTGDVRYIYHGNDGTSMPWNDTAQLNYLNAEVREAVIQKIIDVAKMFPVIRFDAAMTLAKKHYQRLWFPEPGSGGDIPSRADFGLTREEFNRVFPEEFWRQVVDRVAAEVPECLLLAEAFWLMEGYFVRTLGMHRVYNSAFMNMLKNEENTKYRQTIINTIQFNPEILKRYVNFMNNPDEDTAIAQFGDSDKYFGVCVVLVTMPGLPMFGHGQVEGYHEKYGMEYRKAYWDEHPNEGLMQRHEREIFPLTKKRYLFAEVENFLFYDFVSGDGSVNDNVFAYSNSARGERAMVVYNNKYDRATGWVRSSVPFAEKTGNGDETHQVQKSLRQGLNLPYDGGAYLIFRDLISGLEYIRNCKQVCDEGLFFELDGFKYQVFANMYEVQENQWRHYEQLNEKLNGQGVPSISEEIKEIAHKPLHEAFQFVYEPLFFGEFLSNLNGSGKDSFIKEFEKKYTAALFVAQQYAQGRNEFELISELVKTEISAIFDLAKFESKFTKAEATKYKAFIDRVEAVCKQRDLIAVVYFWLVLHALGKLVDGINFGFNSVVFSDNWLLTKRVRQFFETHISREDAQESTLLVKILIESQNILLADEVSPFQTLSALLNQPQVQQVLKINQHENVTWFNKEAFQKLVDAFLIISVVQVISKQPKKKDFLRSVAGLQQLLKQWISAEKKSEYQVERLLGFFKDKTKSS